MKNYKLIFVLFFILTSSCRNPCKDDDCPVTNPIILKIVNTEGENLYDISDNDYTKESLVITGFLGDTEYNISISESLNSDDNLILFYFGVFNKIVINYNENNSDTILIEITGFYEDECCSEIISSFNLKLLDGIVLKSNNRYIYEIIKE